MAFAVKFKLQGVEQCLQKLRGLRASVQRRILKKGVRACVMLAAKRGRPHVPVGPTKLLKKSLGYKVLKSRGGFKAAAMVGPRAKIYRRVINGRPVDPAKYAHLVEGGTKPHIILPKNKKLLAFKVGGQAVLARSVRHPGARGRHFLKKIQSTQKHGMSSAFRHTVETELLKEAAKARPSEVDDG